MLMRINLAGRDTGRENYGPFAKGKFKMDSDVVYRSGSDLSCQKMASKMDTSLEE